MIYMWLFFGGFWLSMLVLVEHIPCFRILVHAVSMNTCLSMVFKGLSLVFYTELSVSLDYYGLCILYICAT